MYKVVQMANNIIKIDFLYNLNIPYSFHCNMLSQFAYGFLTAATLIIPCAWLYGRSLLQKQQDDLVGKFTVQANEMCALHKKETINAMRAFC